MPCSSSNYSNEDYQNLANQQLSEENNTLTQLLCEASRELRKSGGWENMSGQFKAWAKEHDKYDAAWQAQQDALREQALLKTQALAKLSAEERKALGLI